jgi:hypothetical protein
MGYSQTTIGVLGIEITDEQAKKIYNTYLQATGELVYDKADCITTEFQYNHHGVDIFRERHMPQMLADDTDSRIDNLYYSEGSRHVIGVYLASKGYAYGDKIEKYIMNIDKRAYDNFNKYIVPILKSEGIDFVEPEMLLISQVW